MSAKNSIMSASAEKAKEPKLKKQHSLIMNNHDTSQRKESSATAAAASGAAKDKEAGDDKAGQTNEDKFKQFEGEGVVFKTKLIGSELVMEPRGDKMCQNSIQRLKAIIKGQKAHKKRIVMKISYDGVKIYDEKTNELLYHHEVPQISFISSDDTDSRTFGYVCDVPNKAHQFVCFKTSGPAIQVMSVISGLFEAVLEQKRKREEEESGGGGGDNNNSSTTSNNNNNDSKQSDSMLDDQLIIQDKSMTPPLGGARREGPAATSADQRNPSKQSQQQESATAELARQLGHTLSFSSPLDLFDGGDSGIIESPSFNDWPIPAPPPAAAAPNLQAPNAQQHQQHQHQQQPPVSIPERPGLLPLNSASSSPLTSGGVQVGSAPGQAALAAGVANRVLPAGGGGHQNRSLIYNHSSVSLNDAALSNRTSFISPASSGPAASERTDRYAVFNDIDNLPSIFESTSSLGSKTNLSSVGQANGAGVGSNIPFGASAATMAASPFDNFAGGPPVNQQAAKLLHTGAAHSFDHAPSGLLNPGGPFGGRGADPFLSADQQQQRQQQQQQPFQQQYHQQQQQYQQQPQQYQQQQQPYLNQQRHAPTPSMMVPISAAAPSSFAFGPNAGGAGGGAGMIVGSAPMGGHQMSAHARFSSSMVAGLHQRLGSSAASIQSVGSAGGLSRQTNPFDDDFFS